MRKHVRSALSRRLLISLLLMGVLLAGKPAMAHSGAWRLTQVCSWFACYFTLQWQSHDHDAEREEEFRRCVEKAHERFWQRLWEIEKSEKSEVEKERDREIARRTLAIAVEDCEIRKRTGE